MTNSGVNIRQELKDSRIFDKRKAFFLFDSDTLDCVQTKFYGYTIDNGRIIESIEELEDQSALLAFLSCDVDNISTNDTSLRKWPLGVGCYTFVKREPEKILITQDFTGSYGIYLYQDGDYFAVSNSFLYLVEYIEKTAHKISINRDYANSFLVSELASMTYSETMVNEIQLLDRSAVVEINVTNRGLSIHYLDYEENSIEISSKDGMALLDDWYERWTSFITKLKSQNENIRLDLSGGFDSRLTLLLMLGADIDLNGILVYSIDDKLHTHGEDFEIAKEISGFYQFSLNKWNNHHHHQCVNYMLDDILDISFYTNLGFHKQMNYRTSFRLPKRHHFTGFGGGYIRDYSSLSESEYTEQMVRRCRLFPHSQQLEHSVRILLSSAFENMQKKFANLGRGIKSQDMMLNLHRETRNRYHFGKAAVENYWGGVITHSPLLDPQLHKLKLNDGNSSDKNLLIAVIFDRYQMKLLDFKFQGERRINEQTLKYAKAINQQFPRTEKTKQKASECCSVAELDRKGKACFPKTPDVSFAQVSKYVEDIFFSKYLKGIFLSLYDEDTYAHIVQDTQNRKYQPLRETYSVIAIATILQGVYTNETLNQGILSPITNPLNLENRIKKTLREHPYLDNYITARIDIKNSAPILDQSDVNDIKIIKITDDEAKIDSPSWFSCNGKGYVIESQAGHLTISIKCNHAGKLSIKLRSKDVRDKDGEKIPIWIDYYSMTYNNEQVFDKIKPVWHDSPFSLNRTVEDGETIMLRLEWGPHMPQL